MSKVPHQQKSDLWNSTWGAICLGKSSKWDSGAGGACCACTDGTCSGYERGFYMATCGSAGWLSSFFVGIFVNGKKNVCKNL